MKGFINKEYYVYCQNRQEVENFYEMCQDHGLHFSTRWNAEYDLQQQSLFEATFVYDWDDAPVNDGVSFWSFNEGGDDERPCIPFAQVQPSKTLPEINSTDFLSIL